MRDEEGRKKEASKVKKTNMAKQAYLTVLVNKSLMQMPRRNGRQISRSLKCFSFPPSGPEEVGEKLAITYIHTVPYYPQ